MFKKIQMFGAGLFVAAALVFAAAEVATPVAEAAQHPTYTCCRVHNDCPTKHTCEKLDTGVTCPAESLPYTRYCKPVGTGDVITIGNDN